MRLALVPVENEVEVPGAVTYIQVPTKFCECRQMGNDKASRGFMRGAKYGWWIHMQCKRPTLAWWVWHLEQWNIKALEIYPTVDSEKLDNLVIKEGVWRHIGPSEVLSGD